MVIETVSIDRVSIDPSNVRAHPVRNVDSIKASLQKFGQQKPIVVDRRGVIIAGNGTHDAAKALGWTEIRIVRTELEGAEAIAYAIADNRTSDLATWDDPALAQVLKALQEDPDIDVAVTGFISDEITALLKTFAPTSIDDQPRLDEKSKIACPECGHEFTP